ncbi:alpha/beta fold hydrolase [Rhodospira trueperi]|uniref:Pimeloyl-ACP methyl ester carboxylesterase n=1 Tax=Rhodospira trueperi TaxID=69960 RepID=A0A1G7G0U9_9PROT|nr:alpha/beta hydrolase [Rhodospira trueperi]SDE81732.1 Pimeloyl-ACP methyl ester carboxylesterase [Rhodospira trueperi]
MSETNATAATVRHVLCARPEGLKRMSYCQWGPGHGGHPAVICVHGLSRNAHDFDHLGAALGEAGRRVLAPDVLGRGDSDWLTDSSGYQLPHYVSDMTPLIARATAPLDMDQVDWVGTSMGGLIAMLLAASPQSPIRRLVLNDVGPFVPKAALERIAAYATAAEPTFASLEEAEAHYRQIHADFGPMTDADWNDFTRHSTVQRDDGPGGWLPHQDPGIGDPMRGQEVADVDLWPLWDLIQCPVLVLRGARSDLLTAETAAEMTKRGPNCTVHEVPDAGHAPMFTTAEINGVVADFLAA